jgi:hypothetical protein
MRSVVSQRAASHPAAFMAAFQFPSPKLKYLKKPSMHRFEMSPAARASFCRRVRLPLGSRSGISAVAGLPQRSARVMPTSQSTTVWNIINNTNHGLAQP